MSKCGYNQYATAVHGVPKIHMGQNELRESDTDMMGHLLSVGSADFQYVALDPLDRLPQNHNCFKL